MIIGAQLYTVRNFCQTPEDLRSSLRRCAEMGYRAVQLSGVCEYDPAEMSDMLAEYGLEAPITHTPFSRITGQTDAVIAEHRVFGARYIGLGSMPDLKKSGCDVALLDRNLALLAPAVEKIREAGMVFMYHNHNMEFARTESGELLLEHIANTLPADCTGITLDCYWVTAGGGDPAYWLRRLSGRVDCIHLKDMVYSGADSAVRMAPVGRGNLHHRAIVDAAKDAGVRYAFVEQDHCYGEDPFECLKESLECLRALGCAD